MPSYKLRDKLAAYVHLPQSGTMHVSLPAGSIVRRTTVLADPIEGAVVNCGDLTCTVSLRELELRGSSVDEFSHMETTSASRRKLLNSSEIGNKLRDLAVYIRHRNQHQAGSILRDISEHLNDAVRSGPGADTGGGQRARETLLAIEEIRLLIEERDFDGATAAARHAGREWRRLLVKPAV